MRKFLFFVLCVILSSCQSSINKNFENAMKEATGKRVSYDSLMLDTSREQNDSTEMYWYTIRLDDKKDLDIVRDYSILSYKLDSIMKHDYDCSFSTYQAERFRAMQSMINGEADHDGLCSPYYSWYVDSVSVDVSVSLDEKYISVTISRKTK